MEEKSTERPIETRESVVIRFAGDSGDGMQLTGSRFTDATALAGNDVATLPDYPSEIRAPAGTIAGVSGFQIQFASKDIYTPGDRPDVLVAMNPAALKSNLPTLPGGAMIIANADAFTKKNLQKAGFESNPLEDETLSEYRVSAVQITKLTLLALEEVTELNKKQKERSKNFFALGLTFFMFGRSLEPTIAWVNKKFGEDSPIARANRIALHKGFDYGNTTEAFGCVCRIEPASIPAGTYRNVTGNEATALGLIAAGYLAERPLVLGTYPITPATDILHEMAKHKNFDVRTIQAEDEIAGVSIAVGAAFGGALAATTSSGPGISLKAEAIGLAVATELPLVIVNVQRGGPSTGLPTKPEQSDLFIALMGRHGDAPMPVIAAQSPTDCFDMAIEASRIAMKYMTPVMLLTDGLLANSAEPWMIPDVADLPNIKVKSWSDVESFQPYKRDPETLARPWAVPGTVGLEHRIGGLERQDGTGNVSMDPANHQVMANLRRDKVAGIAKDIPEQAVTGDVDSDLLLLSWGSTYGAARGAIEHVNSHGGSVAHAHLRYLNPFPSNLGAVLKKYKKVIIPEANMGQLVMVLRGLYVADNLISYTKVTGQPLTVSEIMDEINRVSKEG